jgi:hypothetical protein
VKKHHHITLSLPFMPLGIEGEGIHHHQLLPHYRRIGQTSLRPPTEPEAYLTEVSGTPSSTKLPLEVSGMNIAKRVRQIGRPCNVDFPGFLRAALYPRRTVSN